MMDEDKLFLKNELDFFVDEYNKTGRVLNEQIVVCDHDGIRNNVFFDVLYRFPSIYRKKEERGGDNDHAITFFVARKNENKYCLKLCILYSEKNTDYVVVLLQMHYRICTLKERIKFSNECISKFFEWQKKRSFYIVKGVITGSRQICPIAGHAEQSPARLP